MVAHSSNKSIYSDWFLESSFPRESNGYVSVTQCSFLSSEGAITGDWGASCVRQEGSPYLVLNASQAWGFIFRIDQFGRTLEPSW